MVFTDITLITEDVVKLVHFYEQLFGISIENNKIHTQFEIGSLRITLYSQKAAESDMEFNFSQFNGTGKMTIGFNFEDINGEKNESPKRRNRHRSCLWASFEIFGEYDLLFHQSYSLTAPSTIPLTK